MSLFFSPRSIQNHPWTVRDGSPSTRGPPTHGKTRSIPYRVSLVHRPLMFTGCSRPRSRTRWSGRRRRTRRGGWERPLRRGSCRRRPRPSWRIGDGDRSTGGTGIRDPVPRSTDRRIRPAGRCIRSPCTPNPPARTERPSPPRRPWRRPTFCSRTPCSGRWSSSTSTASRPMIPGALTPPGSTPARRPTRSRRRPTSRRRGGPGRGGRRGSTSSSLRERER
mmetsp:Transcript_12415/g.36577  ORF Transcript_12415/g.36577 Transcript_12415/m.36577 type:complete len:221 (+) Transcript_12415:321-983(+)